MRQAGIIKAKVGVAGGYCLAKPADKIDLCELLDLFEVYGQKTRKLANKRNRPDVKEIVKLQESAVGCMEAFLGSITVQDILDADGDKEKMGRIIAENMISTGQEMKKKFSE